VKKSYGVGFKNMQSMEVGTLVRLNVEETTGSCNVHCFVKFYSRFLNSID